MVDRRMIEGTPGKQRNTRCTHQWTRRGMWYGYITPERQYGNRNINRTGEGGEGKDECTEDENERTNEREVEVVSWLKTQSTSRQFVLVLTLQNSARDGLITPYVLLYIIVSSSCTNDMIFS